MTSAGTSIEQRSVILVPFPYTDLSGSKKRPSLVISSNEFNNKNDDVICCLITSNPQDRQHAVNITTKDMESGYLEFESKIKPYRLFTVNKKLVYKILGKLDISKSRLVIDEIDKIIALDKNKFTIEQKLSRYFELTSLALKKVKIVEKHKKEAEDLLDLAKRYFDDAKYFEKKGDLVNAYGAIVYAHAFLDIGARLGFFDVGKDNKMFMVD